MHTEWWWLNIYDESGEIGKQAEWKPEENLKDMWFKNILYNWWFKPEESKLTEKTRLERLEELRMKQGRDIEVVKVRFIITLYIVYRMKLPLIFILMIRKQVGWVMKA